MNKIQSESLIITFYCLLLMAAKQKIKFGVYDACRINVKLRNDVVNEYNAIHALASEKEATEEELKQSIETMDNSYAGKFAIIEKSLIKEIEPETVQYKMGEENKTIEIFEVLSILSDKGIIK